MSILDSVKGNISSLEEDTIIMILEKTKTKPDLELLNKAMPVKDIKLIKFLLKYVKPEISTVLTLLSSDGIRSNTEIIELLKLILNMNIVNKECLIAAINTLDHQIIELVLTEYSKHAELEKHLIDVYDPTSVNPL